MSQHLLRVDTLAEVPARRPTYLALGSFDGVHRGHQTIIRQMAQEARVAGVRSAVLTFFPHPKRVISGDTGRFYINTLADREDLLAALGVDLVITHRFDETLRQTRAARFVEQLIDHVDMRQIWGGSFAFGYQREGNIDFLRTEGSKRGFEVRTVETMVRFDGRLVSSSRVRAGLSSGDFYEVNGCLDRLHSLSGIVVEGDKRGRTIGFPTANLAVWDELLLPANGVYATYAWVNGRRYVAASNVGVRPTVNGHNRTVEAHLLDFDEEIYGQSLRLEFVRRVRPEQRFSGLDALRAQIDRDVAQIRDSLM